MEKSIEYLNSKEELDKDKNSNFVLDFTAEWCGPCKHIAPEFERFSKEENFKHIKFYKVDVDKSDELCEEYDINCMPTFIFLKGNKQIDCLSGANSNELRNKIISNFCTISEDDCEERCH